MPPGSTHEEQLSTLRITVTSPGQIAVYLPEKHMGSGTSPR
jgi:hypothetical protein